MSAEPHLTAREAGLVGCRRCAQVWPITQKTCTRCGAKLVSRDLRSLSRVWAWWWAGVLCYIPANLYPMLKTTILFDSTSETIIIGAVKLAQMGSVGIAAVILLASVAIPLAKFACIAWLAWSTSGRTRSTSHQRQALHEIVEYIGRWSMIDVFVVAIMAALVRIDAIAVIEPGIAAFTFALSVIFTMLSAQAFDTRLLWDRHEAVPSAPAAPVSKEDL